MKNNVITKILSFAGSEERVRAVMMNGSRVNPNAPVDILQDYDIVFFVNHIENRSYLTDRSWIEKFGEIVIIQQNDFEDGSYIIMMQFKDGVRIDLSFCDIKNVNTKIKEDSLSKILLDKDNLADTIESPNESVYYVNKPTEKEWVDLLNELWWIQTYVAKGLWRDELPYAKYMYDVIFIEAVKKLLTWKIGFEHNWKINVGYCGKWLKRTADEETYNRFISLYSSSNYEDIWEKLFSAGEFIRTIGKSLSKNLGYDYPEADDKNVTEFLKKIMNLPKG